MRVTGPEPTEVGPDGRLLWRLYGEQFDFEPFVRKHPGGEIAIRLAQGIECTSLFESYHPARSGARRVLDEYRFHDKTPATELMMAPAAAPVKPPYTSPFKRDLDEMVAAHFAGKGRNAHKATTGHMLVCMCFFVAELFCWAGWVRGSWAAAVTLPVFFWLTAVNVSHDASHMAFSSKGWVNEICTFAALPLLYEPTTWYYLHVISHHVHTNDVAVDADLQHFAPLKLHGRDKREHPQGLARVNQFLKMAGVAVHLCLLVPLFNIDALRPPDYQDNFSPAVWIPAGLKPHLKHRLASALGPLVNLSLILYSLAAFGIVKGLLFIIVPWGLCSVIFLLVTQVSHIQPEVQAAELQNEPDFFKRQATTSVDYWVNSNFARIYTGGLNVQALHHSLPYVSSCHYTDLYPGFHAVCARHGIKIASRRSAFHAIATMAQHVWTTNGGWAQLSQ